MTRNGARYQHGNRRLDQFAEALAETGETTAAAKLIGTTRSNGKNMLRRLRRDLGWQAQ